MATILVSGVQYSGIWNISSQANAKAAGTWPVAPGPALFTWGKNTSGQLGLGNTTNRSSPNQVGALINWANIAGGGNFFLASKLDGTLWSWGGNAQGQLGLGNTTSYSSPKQIGSLASWLTVACGYAHSLVIKTDGTLWAWGQGTDGRLGLGNVTYYSSPKQVGALTNWAVVSGGAYHSVAVKTDGTLWAWGFNSQGQLGLGDIASRSSPVQVGGLNTWSKVIGGSQHTVAVKTDGTLWTWGYNVLGQLGLGNNTKYSSPKQVGSLTNWLDIAAGVYYFSVAVKTDGTLWSWGYNNNGQLGLGNTSYYYDPKQVGALTTWSKIAAGGGSGGYTKAITTSGRLWLWGKNPDGELGLGNTTYYSSPKQVGSLATWTKVSSGYSTLAIALA